MNFDDSSIWSEVQDIVSAKTSRILYDYQGTVHTEKEDFAVWDLNSFEMVRDYATTVAGTGRVIFKIGLGDYVRRFYPYRNNLEFTLKRIPLKEGSTEANDRQEIMVERYKAIFNPKNNPPIGGSELETYSSEQLNNSEIVEVYLELVNRSMEPLRIKTTRGSFKNVKMADVIRSILGGESLKVLVDGRPSIDALDIVEPDNKETVPFVVLGDGFRMSSVPTYLQQNVGGVYNRGIGTFFQTVKGKKTWFVYPLYDTERADGPGKKIIFYAVPQDKMPQLDKSYRIDGDLVKVAATAQRKYSDTAELNLINEGSGYRMADARSFMKKPVEMTESGPKGVRTRLNHEVALKERDDGLNYVPMNMNGPSSNPYAARSEVLSRHMAQVDIVWENADPELIFPGMPCRYIYLSEGKPVTLKGTVLLVHAFGSKIEKYNAGPFRMTCRVSIACEPQSKLPELPTKGTVSDA